MNLSSLDLTLLIDLAFQMTWTWEFVRGDYKYKIKHMKVKKMT